jgi:DNA-binding XRE family transcriptional regulator
MFLTFLSAACYNLPHPLDHGKGLTLATQAKPTQIGENLRRLAGLHLASMESLQEEVGVSRQTIFNVSSGRSVPTWNTVTGMAKAFGITTDELAADAQTCLRAAIDHLYDAPIALTNALDVAPNTPSDE